MSILRKAVLGLALTASISGAAFADPPLPIVNFSGTPSQITFTKSGNGGVLAASTGVETSFIAGIIPPGTKSAQFTFSSNMVAGSAVDFFGNKFAAFNSGTFSLVNTEAGDPLLGQVILSGTFSSALLQLGTNSLTFKSEDVVYDGTGYAEGSFNAINFPSNPPLIGVLSLSSSSISPSVFVTGGGFSGDFGGQVSGNFSATSAVPEPGEWAAMGILATGLTGLMVRSRRRRA